ncbi:hypothetical protein HAP94_08425 [Acidithiobacillus ferrivorans]|nr:hypothetical protein [Acidithiobacillus ferrivorans]
MNAKPDVEMDAPEAEREQIWEKYAHESLRDMPPSVAQDVCEAFADGEGEMRELLSKDHAARPVLLTPETLETMTREERVIAQNRECGAVYAMREFRAQA